MKELSAIRVACTLCRFANGAAPALAVAPVAQTRGGPPAWARHCGRALHDYCTAACCCCWCCLGRPDSNAAACQAGSGAALLPCFAVHCWAPFVCSTVVVDASRPRMASALLKAAPHPTPARFQLRGAALHTGSPAAAPIAHRLKGTPAPRVHSLLHRPPPPDLALWRVWHD